MKLFALCLLGASLLSGPAFSQEIKTNTPLHISATEARQHLQANAVVTGKIVEVNKAEKLVRLNFEKPFPQQPFTAVIFASATNLFPQVEDLKDKTVEVRGTITEFHNRPQIILTRTNQLKLVSEPAKAGVSK